MCLSVNLLFVCTCLQRVSLFSKFFLVVLCAWFCISPSFPSPYPSPCAVCRSTPIPLTSRRLLVDKVETRRNRQKNMIELTIVFIFKRKKNLSCHSSGGVIWMLRSHYVLDGEMRKKINNYLIEKKKCLNGSQKVIDCVHVPCSNSKILLFGRNILCRITILDDPVCFFSLMYIVSQFRCWWRREEKISKMKKKQKMS